MTNHFNEIKFVQVSIKENSVADEVARIASSKHQTQDEDLTIEVQTKPSIKGI